MNTLTCPVPLFQRLLQAFVEDPQRAVCLPTGLLSLGPDHEWLARDVVRPRPPGQLAQSSAFRVTIETGMAVDPPTPLPAGLQGELVMRVAGGQPSLRGRVVTVHGTEPLNRLRLPGPGMFQLELAGEAPTTDAGPSHEERPSRPAEDRWSRTAAALGGTEVWSRLRRLHTGVVGCGRGGSQVAASLARLGCTQITLVDPDRIERHNLGEMEAVGYADLGRLKVEALADHLQQILSPLPASIFTLADPITSPTVLAAVRRCDVLVCYADSDAARLATAMLATLYHKIVIDIGAGIQFGPRRSGTTVGNAPRSLGVDVRLIVPGDGCLLCRGSLRDYAGALQALCNPQPAVGAPDDWHRQRAGSLHSLNQLGVSLAMQMLQDLVAERLQASTWLHAEYDDHGHLALHYPPFSLGRAPCPLCARIGLGDRALAEIG